MELDEIGFTSLFPPNFIFQTETVRHQKSGQRMVQMGPVGANAVILIRIALHRVINRLKMNLYSS